MTPPTSQAPIFIGIDLGGTQIKFGCVRPQGELIAELTLPTPQPATPQIVLQAIAHQVQKFQREYACQGIGIGIPGGVDRAGRLVKSAINLTGWQDVPFAQWLEQQVHLPVAMANDANCAGLGEAWQGAGKGYHDQIMLTLGTGVGGSVILGDRLFTGRLGTGAELGLTSIDHQGHPCNSGNRGSIEQHLSIDAIDRAMGKTPLEAAELAIAGDAEALAFWDQYGYLLGVGLANITYIFTPEIIIIGGGIAGSSHLFLEKAKKEVNQRVLGSLRENLRIETAQLGNQAGIIGAARLAALKQEESHEGSQ